MRDAALDLDDRFVCGWVDHGRDFAAVFFEYLGLLDGVWEVGEDELVDAWLPGVDDLLQHFNDESSWSGLSLGRVHVQLLAQIGASVLLALLDLQDVEVDEAVLRAEATDDLVPELCERHVGPDVDDSGLDLGVDLLQSLVQRLVRADIDQVRALLEEREQRLGLCVELPDLLREDS